MPIIKYTKNAQSPDFALLNIYPDQFVTEKYKQSDDWAKTNMDYFYSRAIQQYIFKKKKITPNYNLVKGKLTPEDFGQEPKIKDFVDTILQSEDLPAYVKSYNIMTPALNTLLGELARRPDNVFVKAFDDESKSEELQYKSEVLQQYIVDSIKSRISAKMAMEGLEVESPEELEQMTYQQAADYISSYTSLAERWGSKMLENLKMRFNLKEKSEDGFRDLLISAEEAFHIYEDNSELGFNVETLNPKNVGWLAVPDEQYISDPLDRNAGAYAAWIIEIMELSEVIHKFKLTKEEIDHLKEMSQQSYLISTRESNLTNGNAVTGPNSVKYDTYDPLVLQYRQAVEGELMENRDELGMLLGTTNNVGVFGNKYLIVTAYWCSKKKIGKLTFVNDIGQEETLLVDENYKGGMHPQEIDLEWGWINQWYKGVKIGLDVYYVKPLEVLDYCPIIGAIFEPKNIERAVSLVDQMKQFQMLYNVCMNQLYRLLEKDMGVVYLTSIRHIPVPKDGDYQDALDVWEAEAREKGIIFVDDSPENLGAPSSFNQFSRVDLSRHNEIQARYNLAVQMRNECWKLVGLSEQRVGESKATETATGINSALSQSYAQTEPWFAKHEYVINKLYQALLDAAMYIESHKPESTISFISGEGEHNFVKVNGSDLKLKELGVYVTSRSEDARDYQEMRSLAQAMLQNGATPLEIAELYSTKSMRRMKEIFKKLQDKQDEFQRREQEIKEQQLQQQQAQFEQAQEMALIQDEKNKVFEAFQKEQDRISKEKIAYIQAEEFSDGAVEPSELDFTKFDQERQSAYNNYSLKAQEISQKERQLLIQREESSKKMDIEKEKIKVSRENMVNDLAVARVNAKGRAQKSKPKK